MRSLRFLCVYILIYRCERRIPPVARDLFGSKFPYNRANFGGSPRAKLTKIDPDLADTRFGRVGDDADFRSGPTIHARISRMTVVGPTPSNYYYVIITTLLPSFIHYYAYIITIP